MKEPATISRAPRILVDMGLWSFMVHGRVSSSTGGIKAVRVRELINAMHEALHNPLNASDFEAMQRQMSPAQLHATMQTMAAHIYTRSGRYPDNTSRAVYQRIDFIARDTRDPMFLTRVHVPSDPALFVVKLAGPNR